MIFLSMKFVVASFPVVDFFLQREMGFVYERGSDVSPVSKRFVLG
jgi:hypothetical protein